jgi:hypothetical protein
LALDDSVLPSPEAEAVLRQVGWSADRSVDISEWVDTLAHQGNDVFALAKTIMENFGGLHLRHRGFGGPARYDFEINPDSWYDEREHLALIEEVLQSKVCPLGETSGAALLAVLPDGRVIEEMDGTVFLVGNTWREALDNRIFGRGQSVQLADDYQPLDRSGS